MKRNTLLDIYKTISLWTDRKAGSMHLSFPKFQRWKDKDALCTIMNNSIIPLLYEYFYDNKKKVSRFEGDTEAVKKVVSEEPKQTDIYQVCEYARKRNISDVFLLYPMYRYEEAEPHFPIGKSQGASGDINIHFIRLPFVFEEDTDQIKQQLADVIKDIFGLKD